MDAETEKLVIGLEKKALRFARNTMRQYDMNVTTWPQVFKEQEKYLRQAADAATIATFLGSLTRLTAERDEARARAERAEGALRLVHEGREQEKARADDGPVIVRGAALTQEATDDRG